MDRIVFEIEFKKLQTDTKSGNQNRVLETERSSQTKEKQSESELLMEEKNTTKSVKSWS